MPDEFDNVNPYQPPATASDLALRQSDADSPDGLPWESEGFSPSSWIRTVWLVTTSPTRAFARMKPEGSLAAAGAFLIVGGALGGIGLFIWGSFIYTKVLSEFNGVPTDQIAAHLLVLLVSHVARMAVIMCLVTLVMATVQHICLKMTEGVTRSYSTTLRTAAYANGSVGMLLAVPVVGCLAVFWVVYVQIRGLAEAQQCLETKALLAVVVSWGASLGLAFYGVYWLQWLNRV